MVHKTKKKKHLPEIGSPGVPLAAKWHKPAAASSVRGILNLTSGGGLSSPTMAICCRAGGRKETANVLYGETEKTLLPPQAQFTLWMVKNSWLLGSH